MKLLDMYFKDKSLKDIKFEDLIDFRDILFEIPLSYTTKNFFKGKDLDFIINNNDDYEKLSNNVIHKYIIRVNQYFDYMYKLDYIVKIDFKIPEATYLLWLDFSNFNLSHNEIKNKLKI